MTRLPAPPAPLPPAAEAVIARARRLTRDEVVRLDLAERRAGDVTLTAWDMLRDRLRGPGLEAMRFEARNRSWAAVIHDEAHPTG